MERTLKLFLFVPIALCALGGEPEVVKGTSSYGVTGSTEVVRVSDKAILEYRQFNIDTHETTRYEQPSARSTLLCRVKGKDPSMIRGKLEANGKLLFINPNGIIFSETAQVNVAALIASTLDLQNDHFLKGHYKFTAVEGSHESSIINKGCIEADRDVVLMARNTANYGIISAKLGAVAFLGGKVAVLDFDGDSKLQFAVEVPFKQGSLIEQGGTVLSSQVYMSLGAVQQVVKSVLNDTGVVEACKIETEGGVIRLVAEGATHAKNGVKIQGDTVHVAHAIQVDNGPLDIDAHVLTQKMPVTSKGAAQYKADQIFLGSDITTDNSITLDGAVTLCNNPVIHLTANKYNKGSIFLTSTLDADTPGQTLVIQNERSPTQIQGAIGKQGALGELVIKSGKIIFHDDIGGVNPGITGRLNMKSTNIECRGSTYHTGEQFWNASRVFFANAGECVELKTVGHPLRFGSDARIESSHTSALSITTQGGMLDLAPVISDHPQPVTIHTGQGEAHLKEIGKDVTQLHIEGRDVLLAGHLEADQIFIQAEYHIEYDLTRGTEVIATAVQSRGAVTLNSKQGSVGTADKPLNIASREGLYVGARTIAYVDGTCADQYPHVYPSNPPPRTFFNGYEYNYLFFDSDIEENVLLKTLAPALLQSVPTIFVDSTITKPRKAPVYYDTSSH